MKKLNDGKPVHIVWSWDNPPIHGSVADGTWDRRENPGTPAHVTTENHTMLPPRSPDMHNVIENSHGTVCRAFQAYINTYRPTSEDTLLKTYPEPLDTIFYTQMTQAVVLSMVKRLFSETLPAIVRAGGSYPSQAVC